MKFVIAGLLAVEQGRRGFIPHLRLSSVGGGRQHVPPGLVRLRESSTRLSNLFASQVYARGDVEVRKSTVREGADGLERAHKLKWNFVRRRAAMFKHDRGCRRKVPAPATLGECWRMTRRAGSLRYVHKRCTNVAQRGGLAGGARKNFSTRCETLLGKSLGDGQRRPIAVCR
jgi:hypothetical protein